MCDQRFRWFSSSWYGASSVTVRFRAAPFPTQWVTCRCGNGVFPKKLIPLHTRPRKTQGGLPPAFPSLHRVVWHRCGGEDGTRRPPSICIWAVGGGKLVAGRPPTQHSNSNTSQQARSRGNGMLSTEKWQSKTSMWERLVPHMPDHDELVWCHGELVWRHGMFE